MVDAVDETPEERERAAALLEALFGAVPVGLAILDLEMRFLRVNEHLAALHGAPAASLRGRRASGTELLGGEELAADFREVAEGRSGRVERTVVAPPRTPGEPTRTFAVSFHPIGSPTGVMGVGLQVTDVTVQRAAERSRRHVLGVVGHDLRNPLMAISASAELLATAPLDERATRSVARILRASGRMEGIIRALVDYTSAQGGAGIELRPGPVELSELLRSVAEEFEAAHAGRAVRVIAPHPVEGEWDPDRIGQALANLVGNALQYSPAGSTVDVACRMDDGEAVVEVTNLGDPIPAEQVAHLFEPFRRGDDDRTLASRGLGLGLYIAVQIVAAHGGAIRVRSDAERGTTFSVHLPRSVSRERGRTT